MSILGTAVAITRTLAGLVILVAAEPIIRDNKRAASLPCVALSELGLTPPVTVSGF